MKKFPLLENNKINEIDWRNIIFFSKPGKHYGTRLGGPFLGYDNMLFNFILGDELPTHNNLYVNFIAFYMGKAIKETKFSVLEFFWLYNGKIINDNLPEANMFSRINNYVLHAMDGKIYNILKNE